MVSARLTSKDRLDFSCKCLSGNNLIEKLVTLLKWADYDIRKHLVGNSKYHNLNVLNVYWKFMQKMY